MRVRVSVVVALVAGVVALAAPTPAGAATISVSGTEITIVSTADEVFRFTCVGGNTRVNNVATSPTLACSALTKVTVISSNTTNQDVFGNDLNAAAFSALPTLSASLGNGDDSVIETSRSDSINLGGGIDLLELRMPNGGNGTLDLGAGDDTLSVTTINASDSVVPTSTGNSVSVPVISAGGATSYTALNAEDLVIESLDGDDSIRVGGITAASSIDHISLVGGDGDDELEGGVVDTTMFGNAGYNEIRGGIGDDVIFTASENDSISPGGGQNRVLDAQSLRSGGRSVTTTSGYDTWYLGQYPGDSVTRIQPYTPTSSRITASLTRPGQQVVNNYEAIEVTLHSNTEPATAGIVDVLALEGTTVAATGDGQPRELIDITLPAGGWTTQLSGATLIVDPVAAGYGNVAFTAFGDSKIHGPWADVNQSYAHRVIRDLLFRFPTTSERETLRSQLQAGTKTPATTVKGLMNTDEYRGLDVDRVFVKYLRRVADPGGRTYWINSLGDGKALWRFRAQLFGSNEYFNKAGATNAAYVKRAYNDVLGRDPDPSGQTYWTNKLNNGSDRGQVALNFINSAEARRRLVDDQFLRFLSRLPTANEQAIWVARIPSNTGELDLIAMLTSSSAYYDPY